MKNLLYIFIAASVSLFCLHTEKANAQHVSQGTMMIGGGFSFSSIENDNSSNTTTCAFFPGFSYFVGNNVALGMELLYGRSSGPNTTFTSIGVGPLARGYVISGLFGQVQYTWMQDKFESSFGEAKTSESAFAVGVGYTAFLNNSIALEPLVVYSFEDDGNVFSVRVGIQAFLGR